MGGNEGPNIFIDNLNIEAGREETQFPAPVVDREQHRPRRAELTYRTAPAWVKRG